MNRTAYNETRRSIRDNGLRYTAQHAIDTDNTAALMVCDAVANTMRATDWLAMRQQWASRSIDSPAVVIRLTTTAAKYQTATR